MDERGRLDIKIRATNQRMARWKERVRIFEIVREIGCLTDHSLHKQSVRLERERKKLVQRLDAERSRREERAVSADRAYQRNRNELFKLRYEIEEDLKTGQLTQDEYDSAKVRIEQSLRQLDEPLPPGKTIRILGIPQKKIDYDKIAQALWMQAKRQIRERRGEPPPTPEEDRAEAVLNIQAGAAAKRRRQRDEERKQLAVERRFRRSKPSQLRQTTWEWLIKQGLREIPEDGRFGPLIEHFGGLERADLLQGSVIQLEDGLDYVIDRQAAHDLAAHAPSISLVKLQDRAHIAIDFDIAKRAVTEGKIFDQLDIDS